MASSIPDCSLSILLLFISFWYNELLDNLRKLTATSIYNDDLMLKAMLCLPELRARLAKTGQNNLDWLSGCSVLLFDGIWAESVLKLDPELKTFGKEQETELLESRQQLAAELLPL